MKKIDLNADVGEGFAFDEALMSFISSANIACGAHAGNADIIKKTIELCLTHNVAIGAHPGYADRPNFGRVEKMMRVDELMDMVADQLFFFQSILSSFGATLHHLKPHGALYNKAAIDEITAHYVVKAIKMVDEKTIIYGLSGSTLISVAQQFHFRTVNEVFADRTYLPDGKLTPRTFKDAVIKDVERAKDQALLWVKHQQVHCTDGTVLKLNADSICVHGDNENALALTKSIHSALENNQICIEAP